VRGGFGECGSGIFASLDSGHGCARCANLGRVPMGLQLKLGHGTQIAVGVTNAICGTL